MDNYEKAACQGFYRTLEDGISQLPEKTRQELYRPCAINCVKNFVLKEQQRQFEECGGDLDAQYRKYGRSEFFFADIIESGHVYEIGYPRCSCFMVGQGLAASPTHCECSRQSIIYVFKTLMPEKAVRVEALHTILNGGSECRFRVTVEP